MSRWDWLLGRRKQMIEDLDQDIRDFIERETQDNIARGLPPEEAHYAALRKFGNVQRVREDTWDVWSFVWLEQLWQDVRFGIRILAKNPGFAALAVLSLTLAIGANTAIFSLLDALLLRDLRVQHPESLVELSVVRRGGKTMFSYPMFREIERGQKVFSGLIGWTFGWPGNVELHGELFQATLRSVTANYFSVLGATPLLGRLLVPDDKETAPVAIISYEFWQRRFGGAADVVGKEISIEGQSYTIIGVTRKWFTGMTVGQGPDVTTPMKSNDNRAMLWVFITGRLKDSVTVEQARAQLQSFWPEVLRATASTNTPGLRRDLFFSMGLDVSPTATGVNQALRSQFTRPLYVLMGIVGLILLVACVNLASLLLARASARSHEMSVRVALGATRWTLARQVLTESLALSACGALLGLAFAYWGSRLLVALMTEGHPTSVIFDLRPDWRVLSLTASVAILTGILFGLAPAWRCSREDPVSVLQQTSRGLSGATGMLGRALIITQVALSLVLLLGAGLLVRSFRKLCSANLGFEKESVLELDLTPRPGAYQNLEVKSYHQQLIERLSTLPGVESLGFSNISVGWQEGWQEMVSRTTEAPTPKRRPGGACGVRNARLFPHARYRPGPWPGLRLDRRQATIRTWPSLAGAWPRAFSRPETLSGSESVSSFMPEFQDLEVVGVAGNARLLDLHHPDPAVIYLPSVQGRWGFLFVRSAKSS